MNFGTVGRNLILLLFLGAGLAPPAQAQIGDLGVRLHGGVVIPISSAADYFEPGPSIGLDVGYPLNDRLSLKLDLDFDYINTVPTYPTPPTQLWRYGVGLEGDLLGGQESDVITTQALVGVGLTTFRSKAFWLQSRQPYTFEGERINQTSLAGTGGLRVGLRTSQDLTWWLTGKLPWSPVVDANEAALRELAREELGPLGSALSFAITLGLTLR